MIERACLLLEALAVVVCLHHLYGEKFKLDIITTAFLSINIIIMTIINYYGLSRTYALIIYPIIMIYCGIQFGFKWRAIIINNILYMIIIGGIQLLIGMIYAWIFNLLTLDAFVFKNIELLMMNGGILLFVLFVLPKMKIDKLSIYLQDKERILIISLGFCILLIISSFISFKMIEKAEIYHNLCLFVGISLFCILAGQLGKYKMQSKQTETELKMHKLFADSFQGLIEDIRLRQHEFDNHISAIYSLHYTCNSYEELVKAQNEYSHAVIKENRYSKLLRAGSPLLIGFLYGRFVEIERHGIVISYQISIGELSVNIPAYKLVEILGNLLKNAVAAMLNSEIEKLLYISVIEIDGTLEIEVRNRSAFISYSEIESFFRKGFSKKGKNRGLGLYNVKTICDDYSLNIFCENKKINNVNWLSFIIKN